MRSSDLGQVGLLLSRAFSQARRRDGYSEWQVPACRLGFLRMYLEANPQGSYVVEKGRRIVAFVFTRRWGRVGWFGPLGVDPEEAGKGIGKELVREVIRRLRAAGVHTLGLETDPRSNYNIGFYSKLGFESSQLVTDVVRELAEDAGVLPSGYRAVRLGRAAEAEIPALLATIRSIGDAVCPGVDYRSEAELIIRHSYGDALLLFEGDEAIAMALAHTEPYTDTEERSFLKVFVLAVRPGRPLEDLRLLTCALERWAREEFLRGLAIRVPTRCSRALRLLLETGFRVVYTDLRMVLNGYGERDEPETVHFSKWE